MRLLFVMTAAAALLAPALPARADDAPDTAVTQEGWKLASDVNLTLTQNAYSDNWDGGETGAVSWALNSNSLAENQLRKTIHNKTTLKLAFGQTHNQDQVSKRWLRPSTTTDLIDFESVLRFTYDWGVDPYLSGRAESRFLDHSDPGRTRTLNPTTFTESAGVARVLIKEEDRDWTTRLGAAVRQHVDRDAPVEGTDRRETMTTGDAGLEFVSEFRSPILDGAATFTSDLNVYQALYYSESEDLTGAAVDNWKSPDVNWENTFSAEITKHIGVGQGSRRRCRSVSRSACSSGRLLTPRGRIGPDACKPPRSLGRTLHA
jgi:hypothetical protein